MLSPACNPATRSVRRLTAVSLAVLGLWLLGASEPAEPQGGDRQDRPARVGRLVRVPLPIVGDVDNQSLRRINAALSELRRDKNATERLLVIELDPGRSEFGAGSDFARALRLAEYLTSRNLADVKTVAYLPRTVKGHAVLVALACQEIVMAPEAQIGEAGIDLPPDEPVSLNVVNSYREIARRRGTVPEEIALGMVHAELSVYRVTTEEGEAFVLGDELEAYRQTYTVVGEPEEVVGRGSLGLFSARDGRADRWVAYLAEDREALARRLELPKESLRGDVFLTGTPKPRRFELGGAINSRLITTRKRMIDDAIRQDKVNFVCLSLNSAGGSAEAAISLASFLAELPREVRTVAYIDQEARGVAALVAMACDDIVMHPVAVLGGDQDRILRDTTLLDLGEMVREHITPRTARTWSLTMGMFDPALEVYRYTHRRSGLVEYYSPAELAEQSDPQQWQQGERIVRQGEVLTLNGEEARQLGLATHVVDSFSQFTSQYGLEDDPELAEPSAIMNLIRALARPEVAWALLLIGGGAMIMELQMPGIGIGGFVAAVCFVLYFWANYLDGTADALEVLLFLTGLTFLLMEVFVLPGFGIFGLGGGALILVSLILASQTFVLPHSSAEFDELRNSLMVVGGAGIGVVAIGVLLRRVLPTAPMFRRMMLEPPRAEELAELRHRESLVSFDHLLGQTGVAATQLTPSGKGRFGNQLVDVISDGDLIAAGAKIHVVEVHGNRIVVEAVES